MISFIFADAPGCVIEQTEDDGDIILECIADANPNDVTVILPSWNMEI